MKMAVHGAVEVMQQPQQGRGRQLRWQQLEETWAKREGPELSLEVGRSAAEHWAQLEGLECWQQRKKEQQVQCLRRHHCPHLTWLFVMFASMACEGGDEFSYL